MSKIVLLFSLVFAISFSAVCAAASNASILGNEEKAVEKFLAVLYKNNGTYEEFAPNLTPGLQKKIDDAAMQKLRSQVAGNFGTLKEKKLISPMLLRSSGMIGSGRPPIVLDPLKT